ncbi:ubiquitin-conjugating enzyme E2 S [Vigna unguiculata]|uniref:Ubiquitin-conjugating enzyme E2 S n=1 Tax=Vigna unguiculata TaxID=3917 RepID=A0A4D6MZB8_VIGUN|nr:ubiquitin-conjugating enzyme E2 S [Vigna unguiculata]
MTKFEIIWDWALTVECRSNPIIQAALNIDGEAINEDDDSSVESNFEDACMKKVKMNEMELSAMKKELKMVQDEVLLRVSGDKVHDHVDNSKVSKGYGQKSVKKAKVKREYTSFKVVTVNLDGYRYESTEFVPTPVTSEPIKAATSEPIPTTRNEPIQVYCNSLGVDAMKLYMTLSRVDCPYRVVCNINGQILMTHDCMSFRPMGHICNMAVLFATNIMMHNERKLHQRLHRIIMNPMYTLFAPIVHDDHWWCYCVNCKTMKFFVFDSLERSRNNRTRTNNYIARNMELFFSMLLNCDSDNKSCFEVQSVDTPIQPNGHDCGVLVLKFIKMWDGVSKFDGKVMPNYSTEELQLMRQKFVCDWVLHEANVNRDDVIQHYDLLIKK